MSQLPFVEHSVSPCFTARAAKMEDLVRDCHAFPGAREIRLTVRHAVPLPVVSMPSRRLGLRWLNPIPSSRDGQEAHLQSRSPSRSVDDHDERDAA